MKKDKQWAKNKMYEYRSFQPGKEKYILLSHANSIIDQIVTIEQEDNLMEEKRLWFSCLSSRGNSIQLVTYKNHSESGAKEGAQELLGEGIIPLSCSLDDGTTITFIEGTNKVDKIFN